MSEQTPKPEEQTQPKPPEELTEEDLNKVAGGASKPAMPGSRLEIQQQELKILETPLQAPKPGL